MDGGRERRLHYRRAVDGGQPQPHEINAAEQVDDPASVFAHYRALIALRHAEPVVALGDFTLLLAEHPQVWAIRRRLDGDQGGGEVLMLANSRVTRWDWTTRRSPSWAVRTPCTARCCWRPTRTARVRSPSERSRLRGWESVVYRRPL